MGLEGLQPPHQVQPVRRRVFAPGPALVLALALPPDMPLPTDRCIRLLPRMMDKCVCCSFLLLHDGAGAPCSCRTMLYHKLHISATSETAPYFRHP